MLMPTFIIARNSQIYQNLSLNISKLWQIANLAVIEGESVALLEAIKLATLKGFDHVVFESDSQSLMNAI
jgi:ribonuclease HI